jgi:2-oxoglutarate ferredoxin oxidoreductase subunit beta
VLDIISPCVTFNDHDGSTKSYAYVKEHDVVLHTADFITAQPEIHVDYEPGTVQDVELHDGSHIVLRKLGLDHDVTDPTGALRLVRESRERGELLTGLLYVNTQAHDLCERERLPETPLVDLREDDLRIPAGAWDALMREFA